VPNGLLLPYDSTIVCSALALVKSLAVWNYFRLGELFRWLAHPFPPARGWPIMRRNQHIDCVSSFFEDSFQRRNRLTEKSSRFCG
jgi:hypothetical protein